MRGVQREARAHFPTGNGPARARLAPRGTTRSFVALALAHLSVPRSGFRSEQFQPAQFRAAYAGRVKDFQHGPVAQAQRVGDVGHAQGRFDLGDA